MRCVFTTQKRYKNSIKLYIFYNKRFYIFCLLAAISFSLLAQEEQAEADTTLFISADSLKLDAVAPQSRRVSSNAIDKQVTYSAAGQVHRDVVNQRVILTDQAVVRYGDIEVQADSIAFDMASNEVFAIGRIDTATGEIKGSPVFKQGSQELKSDRLSYNFKTTRAYVKNLITQQDEGIIHSSYAKLLEDGTSNISKSTYSTCDAFPPHFYINIPRGRVYPGEKIVSGPANLVVEGIPLPLIIPFGYFPINTRHSSSGILFPTYGEERERGYSLTNMGYYFSINDYFDLSITGNLYTNGTWSTNVKSNYNKLYKFSGNVNFDYAKNVSGRKGIDRNEQTNYSFGWTYNQAPQASPDSKFSASVSMSSSNYHRQNSYAYMPQITTDTKSSINYSKSWAGTPFNFSASMNLNQNMRTKNVTGSLPIASFTMNRISTLKMGNTTGRTKWYQELQLQYTSSFENRINTTDSLLFTKKGLESMQNGFRHEIPISIPLKPFKNFSVSPSLTYTGVLYPQKIEKKLDPVAKEVVTDTIRGASYGHAIKPTLSAGYSPQLFGTYAFKDKPDARIQAVRHVISPSVGFSFTPQVFGSDLWRTVSDTAGRLQRYSIFESGIYGTPTPQPSSTKKSGSVSLSLNNLLEAKVFSKNDTTGIPKKIRLIDNIGMSTSYNIFADSLRWSDISMNARTTLMEKISISANSNYSIYALDSSGRQQINRLYYNTNNKLLRFKNLSITTGYNFSLDQFIKKITGQPQTNSNSSLGSAGAGFDDDEDLHRHDSHRSNDNFGYQQFNMPWSLNFNYSLTYSKEAQKKSDIRQTLSMNGNVTITKNMTATITSGYDFDYKQITMTTIGIQRDLHCWTMDFNWSPNGPQQRSWWNFTIRAKASILRDLKYDRRKDFHDGY